MKLSEAEHTSRRFLRQRETDKKEIEEVITSNITSGTLDDIICSRNSERRMFSTVSKKWKRDWRHR